MPGCLDMRGSDVVEIELDAFLDSARKRSGAPIETVQESELATLG